MVACEKSVADRSPVEFKGIFKARHDSLPTTNLPTLGKSHENEKFPPFATLRVGEEEEEPTHAYVLDVIL